MLIGLDRDRVGDAPGRDAADRDRGGGRGDGILLGGVDALFQDLRTGDGGGLGAEADAGGDGAIFGDGVGNRALWVMSELQPASQGRSARATARNLNVIPPLPPTADSRQMWPPSRRCDGAHE